MAYTDFYRDFKDEKLKSTIFLYGEEDYLIDWALNELEDRYLDEASRVTDYQVLDGSTCQISDIVSAARAYSMFSEKRIVVVDNFASLSGKISVTSIENRDFFSFLDSENDSSIIVFTQKGRENLNAFGKKLAEKSSTYDFCRLTKSQLSSFINKRIKAAGNMIGRREMEFLIELSGYYNKESTYHIRDIVADIERINNACVDSVIEMPLIEELMIGEADRFVFNMIDAMMAGNKKKAMEIVTEFGEDDRSEVLRLIGLLVKQFEIMYDAIELSEQGMSMAGMAKATGVNEFRFKRAYQAARHFSKQRIKELLIKLYDIDKDFKTGTLNEVLSLQLFVASI